MNRFVGACLAAALVPSEAGAAPARLTAIVSDLHLDERGDRGGREEAFSRLLIELHERSGGSADLILNGDVFELAPCEGGCDVDEAVSRLDGILDAHESLVESLAAFAKRETNRVVFVPGDRDAALLFPAVSARVQKWVGGEIAEAGLWVSEDGRIVAEHGHQLPGDPYRFEGWPRPFDARGRMETSWGERELESIYERLESTFPLVDAFATRLAGLKYGLAVGTNEPPSADVLKLFLLRVSWQQFRRDLELEVDPPEWDLSTTRSSGDDFLLQSVPEDDPLHDVWRRAVEEKRLTTRDLTDAEVRLVCDYRAAVRRARRRMERGLTQLARVGPAVAECPRSESSRDPSFSYYWSSRDALYRARLAELSKSLDRPPEVYVHGHTHLADRGFVPGEASTPRILNAGAFKRVLTPARFEAIREAEDATIGELLDGLRLKDLPACLSFVLVPPYEEAPAPRLWYWSREADGELRMSPRCEE